MGSCGYCEPYAWIPQQPRYMKVPWQDKKGEFKAIGRTKGGLNTKIHTFNDALGNPLEFLLTAGNINDSDVAVKLLSRLDLSKSNRFVKRDDSFLASSLILLK